MELASSCPIRRTNKRLSKLNKRFQRENNDLNTEIKSIFTVSRDQNEKISTVMVKTELYQHFVQIEICVTGDFVPWRSYCKLVPSDITYVVK